MYDLAAPISYRGVMLIIRQKHFIRTLILLIILFLFMNTFIMKAGACTVFSVQTEDNIYYGKNWDSDPGAENYASIILEDLGDGRTCLKFLIFDSLCSSITSDGFFVSCNAVDNIKPGDVIIKDDREIMDITFLRNNSSYFTKVEELKNYISDKNVLCYVYAEHIFYADNTGAACLVETDNSSNKYIIEPERSFLIATNFPLYSLFSIDMPKHAPCARYQIAYFDINKPSSVHRSAPI